MAQGRVQSHMNEIGYSFGTGDGEVHHWSSLTDLDLAGTGALDAVCLDFDGDGLADDALWETGGEYPVPQAGPPDGFAGLDPVALDDIGRLADQRPDRAAGVPPSPPSVPWAG
ncbi:hypothetical protein [Nocardia elegans]|nr:hypothetical protein [Nocardia elegans]